MLPAYALASYSYFHFAYEFLTRRLAYKLDSLVRVSGLSQMTAVETCSASAQHPSSVFRLGPDYTLSRTMFCPPTSSL